MNLLSFKLIKTQSKIEIIVGFLSILFGFILTYVSLDFLYAYHFSSRLFLVMIHMTELVSALVIGLFLSFSGFYLLRNHSRLTVFYKLTGMLIMLYPFNLNFLEYLKEVWSTFSLMFFMVFPLGLFLFLFMRQSKYTINEGNYRILKLDKSKLTFVLLIYFLIDIIFYNWYYF